MKALLSICLFWGLLSPACISAGEPEGCFYCVGDGCASPSVQKCKADEDACISAVYETTLFNSMMGKYLIPFRKCAPAHFCLHNYITVTTSDGGTIRFAFQCCYTDQCNNMTISLPKRAESPLNGVECPACFALDSEGCPGEETINCTGGETKCVEAGFNVSIEFLEVKFAVHIQGCAIPSTCFIPLPDGDLSPKNLKINFTERNCRNGVMNV